jgi:hypothetical protein
MKKRVLLIAGLLLTVLIGVAIGQIGPFNFFLFNLREFLTGYEEVPAISTPGKGELRAFIKGNSAIDYQLSFSDLEAPVTQSHIHFGQEGVNGGISVWLCSNLASPPTPAGVQPCPPNGGTIFGTIVSTDVVGPTAQGINPGEFSELLQALRAGKTYVNIHTTKYPGGEVRKQINHEGHTTPSS